jgi:hypothetical protein
MGAGSHRIDPMAPLALKEEGDFVFVDVDPRHLLKAFVGPKSTLSHLHMCEKCFPTYMWLRSFQSLQTEEMSDRHFKHYLRIEFPLGISGDLKTNLSVFDYGGIHFSFQWNSIVSCTISLISRKHTDSTRMGIQNSLASIFCTDGVGFSDGQFWSQKPLTTSFQQVISSGSPPKSIKTTPPRCPSLQLRLCSSSKIKPTWL